VWAFDPLKASGWNQDDKQLMMPSVFTYTTKILGMLLTAFEGPQRLTNHFPID